MQHRIQNSFIRFFTTFLKLRCSQSINFNTLKTSLEAIPENNDVIIDFSLCGFVDHSSMENIDDYQELFHKKGGNIEVIGLDVLGAESKHPFALRRMLPVQKMMPDNKTKRQKNLGIISDKFELSYEYETDCLLASFEYQKKFFRDDDLVPDESLVFLIKFIPFVDIRGAANSVFEN